MGHVEEKLKPARPINGTNTLLEEMKILKEMQDISGLKKPINSMLWHACAGPLVNLPQVGSLVYYFPQGHSEQDICKGNLAIKLEEEVLLDANGDTSLISVDMVAEEEKLLEECVKEEVDDSKSVQVLVH